MLRYILSGLMFFHALIHLLGFVKGYKLADISQLMLPVSKIGGTIWMLAFLLLISSTFLFVGKINGWWWFAFSGVILSQVLIIGAWQDAKFGSILNLIILIVAITAFAKSRFNNMVQTEINQMFQSTPVSEAAILTQENIQHLPVPVQQWLQQSGAIGKEIIHNVWLKQKVWMKTKPGQKEWIEAEADQFFTVARPAFVWKVSMQMMPMLEVVGRDKYMDGKGSMIIKALGLINMVNAADEKIDQGTLQRYLAEIIWFPSAAVSPYIHWESIDSVSAKATMNFEGISGSGIFHFNEQGQFKKFTTQRYMGSGEEAVLREWEITSQAYREINGFEIPVKLEVVWKLEEGDFNWLKLEIIDIKYNQQQTQ